MSWPLKSTKKKKDKQIIVKQCDRSCETKTCSFDEYPCMLSHFCRVLLFAIHGLQPSRLLCPWNSPGRNTGVGCRALLQEIFLTQGSAVLFLTSPALVGRFLTTGATWKTHIWGYLREKSNLLLCYIYSLPWVCKALSCTSLVVVVPSLSHV